MEYLLSVILQKDGVNKSSPSTSSACTTQQLFSCGTGIAGKSNTLELLQLLQPVTCCLQEKQSPRTPKGRRAVETQKTVYKQQSVSFVQFSSYLVTKGARRSLADHRELLLSCATITQDQQKHSQEPEVASNCLLILDACQQLLFDGPEWAGIFYGGKKKKSNRTII